MKDTRNQLSGLSVVLHWGVGLAVIGMLALGIYMEETETHSLYGLHKSIGVVVLVAALARVLWRYLNRWPSALSEDGALLRFVAKLAHWVLLLGTVLMPLSGLVMSVAGGHSVPFFGLELIAGNPDPADPTKALPRNEALAGFAHASHGIIANVVIAVLLLHIAGAFKHHLINKDGTLRRMLGRAV
ncbi:MAG: cytochrome b [Pseudomonadales bacterium]